MSRSCRRSAALSLSMLLHLLLQDDPVAAERANPEDALVAEDREDQQHEREDPHRAEHQQTAVLAPRQAAAAPRAAVITVDMALHATRSEPRRPQSRWRSRAPPSGRAGDARRADLRRARLLRRRRDGPAAAQAARGLGDRVLLRVDVADLAETRAAVRRLLRRHLVAAAQRRGVRVAGEAHAAHAVPVRQPGVADLAERAVERLRPPGSRRRSPGSPRPGRTGSPRRRTPGSRAPGPPGGARRTPPSRAGCAAAARGRCRSRGRTRPR